MSNVNLEDDHEALIVPKNLYKNAFISPTNKDNSFQHPRINRAKENDITLSLLGTGQLHFNDFMSPKSFGINLKNEDAKHNDMRGRDIKQILKDTHSPNSLNSSNLSYKILNEILNTQQGDRAQTRAKLNTKSFEGKKTGPLNKTIECTADLLNSSKPFVLEENEEIRVIQDKIKFFASQLQTKMHILENRKRVFTEENNDLQENQSKLEESLSKLTKRLGELQKKRTENKDRVDVSVSREKLKRLSMEVKTYDHEIIKLEELIQKQEKDIGSRERAVEQEFESDLRELEHTLQDIQDQKVDVINKITQIENSYNEDLEKKAMLKEDLNGRLLQRAELVAQREELDAVIEMFRENNSTEINFYNLEVKTKKALEEITRTLNDFGVEKKRLLLQLKEITNYITNINDQFFLSAKNYQISINEKEDRVRENSADLEKIETLMNKKAQEFNLPRVDALLSEIFADADAKFEQKVLHRQLKLVEEEQYKLERNFENKRKEILRTIDTLRAQKGGNSEVLRDLENKLHQLNVAHTLRMDTIANWRDSVKENLLEEEVAAAGENLSNGFDEYQALYDKASEYLQVNNIGEKGAGEFLELLSMYFETVTQHEIFVSERVQEENKLKEEEKLTEKAVTKAKEQRVQIEQRLRKSDEDFVHNTKKKKEYEEDLNVKRSYLEQAIMKEAESAFNAYLQDQAATFDVIGRTYGPRAAQNLKKEHFKEFVEITKNNLMKKMEKYKDLESRLTYFDNVIKENTTQVDQKMLPSLKKILASFNDYKEGASSLKKDQLALLEAEDEINGQLSIILSKIDEKKKTIKEDFDSTAIQSVKNLKETKRLLEKRMKTAQDEASKLENYVIDFDKQNTQELLEERRVQKEMKEIEQKLEQINTISKPKVVSAESDLDHFEKEIMSLRKNIEQLEIQKFAIEQKFVEQNYLIDEANQLGSYVILNDKSVVDVNTSLHEGLAGTINFNPQMKYQHEDDGSRSNSWKNLELSPIKNSDTSSIAHKKDVFDDHLPQYHSVGSNQQILNIDDYQSAGSNISHGQPQFFRRMSMNAAESNNNNNFNYMNQQQQQQHRRFDSNPHNPQGSYVFNERKRNSFSKGNPMPAVNVNVNLKNLMDVSMDQHAHNSSIDAYKPPRKSLGATGSMKDENYLNLPLQQRHPLPPRISPELTKQSLSKNNSKENITGAQRIGPLKTIAEEQTTFRDAPKNIRRLSVPSNQLSSSYAQNKLKQQSFANKENSRKSSSSTLRNNNISSGNSISLDKTAPTDHYHSLVNSSSTNTIDYSSYQPVHKNHLSTKRYPSNERLNEPSIMLAAQMASKTNNLVPNTSYGLRSRSLGAAVQKNQGFEPQFEETIRENHIRPQSYAMNPLFDLSNYASVPVERTDNSFIRFAQGKLTSSGNGPRVKVDNFIESNANLIETLKPLLEGRYLFKKFTTTQSLKKAAFDPLTGETNPPEACGYGMRCIRLHPTLEKIELKHAFKPGTEMSISFASILRPIVPQVTMDILRVQKKIFDNQNSSNLMDGRINLGDNSLLNFSSNPMFMQQQKIGPNSRLDKYMNCSYYPFSILLEKGGRLDFVAPNYDVFKEWINGLNYLLKNKKNLAKIRRKIEENYQPLSGGH